MAVASMARPDKPRWTMSEIASRLAAALEEGLNPSSQVTEDSSVAFKTETVLLALVNNLTRASKPRERELGMSLNLLDLAMCRLPGAIFRSQCATALSMLTRLIPLFALPSLRTMHERLVHTVETLIRQTAGSCRAAYTIVLEDICSLTIGCRDALLLLSTTPEAGCRDSPICLDAFQGIHAHIASSTSPSQSEATSHSLTSIEIASVEGGKLLTVATLQVLRCCTELTPCIMAARIDLRLLNAILELVNGGGFTVQTAGLGALSSALRTLELDIYRSALILRCLHEVIELWVRAGPFRHELLPAWTAGLELCLEHLAVAAPGMTKTFLLSSLATVAGCPHALEEIKPMLHRRLSSLPATALIPGDERSSSEQLGQLGDAALCIQAVEALHETITGLQEQTGPAAIELTWKTLQTDEAGVS